MARAYRWTACVLGFLALAGCSSPQYSGYKCKPYTVRGHHYEPLSPQEAVGYVEEGVASHYHEGFLIFPGKTALGESLWFWSSSGAHKTLPLPCTVRVTNLQNGRSVVIRLNDRGPYIGDRVIDVTTPVAKKLGFYHQGLARVRVEVLSVGDGKWRIKTPRGYRQPTVYY
ncbi:rare lipoprotein A [Terrimicrobium sacchariphilum]|uniref:Probable endolytic peptidoglycan transglycosylase RlpA n=1 Tax=Terrimicrobium sacchariphilum TaxID=690879 RepID=A0A146GDX2_TERSA|nr:septal ring lytic transglycosylase RlpA family protein [Terrimicrobium sacchariphilum]GAT35531.1 rare lipoprotein A [Terrimicrobium sacchariphilum]